MSNSRERRSIAAGSPALLLLLFSGIIVSSTELGAQPRGRGRCDAEGRSIFARCAEASRNVDPALCERLLEIFREGCGDEGGDSGSCSERCDGDSVCERECVAETYDGWRRRAEQQNELLATFDAVERTADVRQNLELTRAAKELILDQTRRDFEAYRFTYERDRPVIQPPCGDVEPQPLRLLRVWAQGLRAAETTTCSGGNLCAFPNEFDVAGFGPVLTYRLETMNGATAQQYLDGVGGKRIRVLLNGFELARDTSYSAWVAPCGSSGDCLQVSVPESAWYPEAPPWPTWRVEVLLEDDQLRVDDIACTHLIQPAEKLKSFWLYTIGETVSSSRCTSCHGMNTRQQILLHHQGYFSESDIEVIPSALHPTTQSIYGGAVCANCHFHFPANTFDEERWATPTPEQNIDWGELIVANFVNWPYALCNRMVTNLDTPALRAKHFKEDARLFWAVGSGLLPFGGPLPTAPPHDYLTFVWDFDRWNDHGAPCPPDLF